jgi:hypothetical protein
MSVDPPIDTRYPAPAPTGSRAMAQR